MMHIVVAFPHSLAGGVAAAGRATRHLIASVPAAPGPSSAGAASLDAMTNVQYAAQERAYWAARPILAFCYDTPVGQWVRNSAWAFPFLQSWHFIGMTMLIGPLFALDLRVLGVARAVPLAPLHRFLPLVFVGFGINLATGICFFCHDPRVYAYNISFRIKMLLILLAALNALWFRLGVFLDLERWGPGIEASRLAKVISALSIVIWLAVITAGRYIAFT
ncbi:MAG TPA: hypothetical protein VMF64_14090 [Steroidobacteraceae bacterium]|nr:hypothetical protein [Steroidobacteraceae bacterium]